MAKMLLNANYAWRKKTQGEWNVTDSWIAWFARYEEGGEFEPVKEYSRPAAGQPNPQPQDIRYSCNDGSTSFSWSTQYTGVNDIGSS